MEPKRVIHCPNDKIHPKIARNKVLFITGKDCLYMFCSDSRCAKDRNGTWTKVEFKVCGKPLRLGDASIKLTEMPKHYHFDLAKEPFSVESNT